jgi:HprK-related kinase A
MTAPLPADTPRIGDLEHDELAARLAGPGIGIELGPFDVRIRARVPGIVEPLRMLYRHYPVLDHGRVFSFHVELDELGRSLLRRKRLVRFVVDARRVHEDQPLAHALPTLEWGINLVIAMRFHCFMMLHAAVLERNGGVLLLPALPGHGKTTLCAALAHRGWRLFSDEFGLVRPGSRAFLPLPRPMPLKNESIAVIRHQVPEAVLGPEIANTKKGTVAHVRPPGTSIERQQSTASARWIVFPRWVKDAPLRLQPMTKSEAFLFLATNAFNYELLGEPAFHAVRDLIDACGCYRLTYSRLDEAIERLTALADRDAA